MEKKSATIYLLAILGALLVTATYGDNTDSTKNISSNGNNTITTFILKMPKANSTNDSVSQPTNGTASPTTDASGDDQESTSFTAPEPTITNVSGPNTTPTATPTTEHPDKDNNTESPSVSETKSADASGTQTTMKTARTTNTDHKDVSKPTNAPSNGIKPASMFIIIFIIALVTVILAIICCVRSNRRRSSEDINGKVGDPQIPLASVDPELCDFSSTKDMKTFTFAENSTPATETAETTDEKATDMKTLAENSTPATETAEKTKNGENEEKAPAEADQQVKESAESETTATSTEKPAELVDVDLTDKKPPITANTSTETVEDPPSENNTNIQA
ncbi:mucin-2 isoform X1 [Trichomycterus rosablanca]|uniref:mucin-2 isoform X1 n=1 Tax=Trichomycterus rosablanca TaxID=2290929 RepID=UPI002F357B4E